MLAMLLALATPAQAGDIGLGIALGSPTGITLKAFLSDTTAIDVLVGEMWEGWKDEDLFFSVDFIVHPATLTEGGDARLDFYLGGGVNAWVRGPWLGVEMPLGLSLMFRKVPIEVFLEAVPMVIFWDYGAFEGGGSLGARYYF